MITSITLQNYKSFGEPQTVPLAPITVLVGPNNSGKSSFLSIGRFVQTAVLRDSDTAFANEGGEAFVFHRPRPKGSPLWLKWQTPKSEYSITLADAMGPALSEKASDVDWGPLWRSESPHTLAIQGHSVGYSRRPFGLLDAFVRDLDQSTDPSYRARHLPLVQPILDSRFAKLSIEPLRQDSEVVPDPQLGSDGSGLAAVLGLWRGSDPDRSEALDQFLRSALPEVKRALVKPAPKKSYQRLWIEQKDGEQFDAPHLSDGLLYFTALAMHALSAPPGAILFIEEPEICVHPRRLKDLVDLFRRLVQERGCQLVIATHSPILLDQFRDEPEAIVLFQRGEKGTQVRRLSDDPKLVAALDKAEPGLMLANGFFNEPF